MRLNTNMISLKRKWFLLACLLVLSMPVQVMAWGALGHQVIARLAEQQLTPTARTQVQRLLALEPGSTLASISTWADEHRNPTTARWHYVNFSRESCSYEADRNCPDGNCVIRAIEAQVAILKSDAPDARKLVALKYLVHFVGDVHQPLHAGYADDRGGNLYQVRFLNRGTNLHALWDSGLLMQISDDVDVWVDRLSAPHFTSKVQSIDAIEMAQESCRIVATQGFYPSRKITAPYVSEQKALLDQRLQLAGFRLSGVLAGIWE